MMFICGTRLDCSFLGTALVDFFHVSACCKRDMTMLLFELSSAQTLSINIIHCKLSILAEFSRPETRR